MAHTRAAVPAHRWAPRRWHTRGRLLSASDFVNPHLGLSGSPQPELFEGTASPATLHSVIVATDGLGLDQMKGEDVSVADRIATLMNRTPPPGMTYAYGDIAVVQVTATP